MAIRKVDLIDQQELELIHKGLDEIHTEWVSGNFVQKENDEDIHTANERRLRVI